MKKALKFGCVGILGLCFLLVIGLMVSIKQAFGPINETIQIDQEVGGKLICRSKYNADLASWFYDIEFEYQSKNQSLTKIGNGEFYAREWNRD